MSNVSNIFHTLHQRNGAHKQLNQGVHSQIELGHLSLRHDTLSISRFMTLVFLYQHDLPCKTLRTRQQ
jgi:hypothetical protein